MHFLFQWFWDLLIYSKLCCLCKLFNMSWQDTIYQLIVVAFLYEQLIWFDNKLEGARLTDTTKLCRRTCRSTLSRSTLTRRRCGTTFNGISTRISTTRWTCRVSANKYFNVATPPSMSSTEFRVSRRFNRSQRHLFVSLSSLT